MKLLDYNLMFIYVKGSNSILADAISRLNALGIYKDPLDYLKTSDMMTCVAEMVTTEIQTLSIDKLHAEQKKDIYCTTLAAQSHHENKNTFNFSFLFPSGLL